MTKDELKKWFIDKFNSCYAVKHDDYPERFFLLYDKSITRKIKLCELNNIECKIDNIKGTCLFDLNFESNFIWCNNDKIWTFIENNYSDKYDDIADFIKSILEEQEKLKVLTPTPVFLYNIQSLKEKDKLNVLTPGVLPCNRFWIFDENNYKLHII